MTIAASGRSVGIIDLGRVARGMEELADIVGHGLLKEAHGSSVLGAAERADHALGRVVESLAQHQPAAVGVEHLRSATTHLHDAMSVVTATEPEPSKLGVIGPFLSRNWDAKAAVDEFRATAASLRSAQAELASTSGVHLISDANASVLLHGAEREAALAAAAARVPVRPDGPLSGSIARFVDAQGIGDRQATFRRRLDATSWLHHTSWTGSEKIPATGSAIVLGTHGSYADPVLVGAGIPRETHVMMDKQVFRMLGQTGEHYGAYPVDRAGGAAAAEAKQVTNQLLADGKLVHIYPDGGVVRLRATIPEPKSGAAIFGLTTGTPIVPSASAGLQPKFARWDLEGAGRHIIYGDPLVFRHTPTPTAEQIAEARELIAQHTDRLMQQAVATYRAAAH
ncbi:MAG: putative acyltransferase [Thermoleophilia bacterium]|nr:putative acyltransferase [Thermoleophilia bacterium]